MPSAFCTSSAQAGHGDLLDGAAEREHRVAQREARVLFAALGAERRLAEALLDGGGLSHAGVGQREHAPAFGLLAPDDALVLEQLQRRVHRAGAGSPGAPALLLEPLHDLIAVHRLVGEHQQDRRAHVASPGA